MEKEIILIGNEKGIGRAAYDLDCLHVLAPYYQLGTFHCSDLERLARKYAQGDILVHVSGDVTLSNIEPALDALTKFNKDYPDWFAVARSWDHGVLQNPYRLDVMMFPSGTLAWWPDILVGRPKADGAVMYGALSRGLQCVDVTDGLKAEHQGHEEFGDRSLWAKGRDYNANIVKKHAGTLHCPWVFREGRIEQHPDPVVRTGWKRI